MAEPRRTGYKPADLKKFQTMPIHDRRNLVNVSEFGTPTNPEDGCAALVNGLPDILAARNIRKVAAAICQAKKQHRPVIAAFGAHVVKTGAGPYIIDLMKRGYITGIATNGAGAIHDTEIALIGATSEDVAENLPAGAFGSARETGELFGAAAKAGAAEGIGLGAALGRDIEKQNLKYAEHSLLACAWRMGLPATVHVGIGTDFIHMHPTVSGADLGEASHIDFRILCSVVSELDGGVWMNIGSAVILPEVFMKALNAARNLGAKIEQFTAVDMDMIRQYRPRENVLSRPHGQAFALTGHHELMLPLLRMAILIGDVE